MHIHISACGDAPCWVYSNENVSGQLVEQLEMICIAMNTQADPGANLKHKPLKNFKQVT